MPTSFQVPREREIGVAARLAAALNKTTPEKVLRAQAPDVFVTEPASRSRKIVVDQIRGLERALQLRARRKSQKDWNNSRC